MTETAVGARTLTLKVSFTEPSLDSRFTISDCIARLNRLKTLLDVCAYMVLLENPELNPLSSDPSHKKWDLYTYQEAQNYVSYYEVDRLTYQSPLTAWLVGGGLVTTAGALSAVAIKAESIWGAVCNMRKKHHETSRQVASDKFDRDLSEFFRDQVTQARRLQARRFELENKWSKDRELEFRLGFETQPPRDDLEVAEQALGSIEQLEIEER